MGTFDIINEVLLRDKNIRFFLITGLELRPMSLRRKNYTLVFLHLEKFYVKGILENLKINIVLEVLKNSD